MISYELAKSLKEARFPQRLGGGDCYNTKGVITPTSVVFALKEILNEDFSSFYAPTLSELIDQCVSIAENDFSLYEGWTAEIIEGLEPGVVAKGKTPEESVAKLWLALQKDK